MAFCVRAISLFPKVFRRRAMITLVLTIACALTLASSSVKSDHDDFNRKGNILISDQFNNRVIEIKRSGEIIWQFGLGPNDDSENSIVGVNDAQRVGELTLMAGTGNTVGSRSHFPQRGGG
jgi:hypothetical protein